MNVRYLIVTISSGFDRSTNEAEPDRQVAPFFTSRTAVRSKRGCAKLQPTVPGKPFGTIQRELRKFSQRIGVRRPPRSGLEEASPELRTALWNVLHKPAFPN